MSEKMIKIFHENFYNKRLVRVLKKQIKKLEDENKELRNDQKFIDSDNLPPNSNPVNILRIARFLRYKKTSQQAKKGIVGRWQEWNGYGYTNCETPSYYSIINDQEL